MALDAVFKTFSKLEQNYARSSKDRQSYIEDKFGGDIEMGSFLILHALSKESITSPEDVEKLSFIRKTFDYLLKHKDHINALSSFVPNDNSLGDSMLNALRSGYESGTKVLIQEQTVLNKRYGAYHFHARAHDVQYTPISIIKKLRAITPVIGGSIEQMTGEPAIPFAVYGVDSFGRYVLTNDK